MKKILPFETSPYLDLYQYNAFSFGILQGYSNTYPWIYSNFIQYDINGEDIWLEYRKAFSRTHIYEGGQDYPREGILDSIKNCILNDYYVLGYYDEFYIPQKWYMERRIFYMISLYMDLMMIQRHCTRLDMLLARIASTKYASPLLSVIMICFKVL